ncbi:receptor-like protein eix2 [Quercus suber]|uniref:Receptor-like protein eix2 n=1 Tax=Quercus suber TaxID=58331 RepID=A0AAW0JWP5_QUESU
MSMIMDRISLRLLHAFLMLLLHLNPALGFISGVGDAKVRKGLVDDYDILSSWGSQDQKKNCCKWKGVHCSKHTGHVLELDLRGDSEKTQPLRGKLSFSLLELHHLSSLDLSYNDFNMSQIPEFLGSFNNLKHLYLLEAEFGGTIPYELGNLSHLESIDLSANNFNNVANLQWLSHLSSLKEFVLNSINLSEAYDWADVSLSSRDLPPIAPSTHTHFNYSKSLTTVDLSDNHQNSSIFGWLLNFNTSLVEIDLSSNQLSGQLVEFINILSGCAKDSLEILDLSLNQMTGSLPDFSTFSSLKQIYVGTNNVTGTVPEGIGNFHQLEVFDVSNNSMHGVVTEVHLSNLSNLWFLDLSLNSLALQLNKDWIPPFQLRVIYLSSCKLGPRFPSWLQTQ